VPRITKRAVDALRPDPAGRDRFLWDAGDGSLKGFGVRMKSSGTASYLVQYRNRQGRTRRCVIGRVGVLTPDQARALATDHLREVAKGGDPAAQRQAERSAITVAELCREYLNKAERGLIITRRREPKRLTTVSVDRGRIERHIVPLLGSYTVKDLTQKHVRDFMRDVIAGKTKADVKTKKHGRAIVRGGRGTATRTMGLLGAILSYAVEEGYRENNPTQGIVRPADQRRSIRFSAEDFSALGQSLNTAEAEGEHWQVVAIIRLLALTGLRPGEIRYLRWSQVDEREQCLRLDQTKEGRSKVRPLSTFASAVLRSARVKSGSGELVFPAVRKPSAPFSNLDDGWARTLKRAGISPIPPYALRHAFHSVADELGYSEATVGALVGNGGHGVTAGYIRHSDEVLLAAANRAAERIDSMMRCAAQTVPDRARSEDAA
jgi:integrase